jgi:hypothetical protein
LIFDKITNLFKRKHRIVVRDVELSEEEMNALMDNSGDVRNKKIISGYDDEEAGPEAYKPEVIETDDFNGYDEPDAFDEPESFDEPDAFDPETFKQEDSSAAELLGFGSFDEEPDIPVQAQAESPPEPPKQETPSLFEEDDPFADMINLDDQIDQLLKADSQASENLDLQMMEGLVQDRSIYDGELSMDDEAGDSWAAYGKNKSVKTAELFSVKPTGLAAVPFYQVCILAVFTLVFITGISFLTVSAAQIIIERREEQAFIAHYTPIVQPVGVANNANFIHINESGQIAGQRFTLSKISAGSTGTFVYFEETFDPSDYAIVLYDQTNLLLYRSHFDMAGEMTEGTVLRFDSVKTTSAFLNLLIQDLVTHESIKFFYRFEDLPTLVPEIYFLETIEVFKDGGMDFNIHSAVYDNASTSIFYTFNSEGGTGELRFGDYSDKPFMQVTESIYPLPAMTVNPTEARFDGQGLVLGKLTLAPVRNIRSTLEITFNDLFYHYPMDNKEVDMTTLFTRRPEEQKIRVGGNELILEGMAKQGDYIVLVLHGNDADGQRIETRINATLTVLTDDGLVVLHGVSRASREGCDLLFDTRPHRESLLGIPLSGYRLNIQSTAFRVPRFTVEMDLSNSRGIPDRRIGAAREFVLDAFYARLMYKSYELSRNEINGFDEDVLNDRALMRIYTPVGAAIRPMYAAHIIVDYITDDNKYIAIVEDEWIVGEGKDMTYMRHTHRIVAERVVGGTWVIISDEIM